MFEVTYDKNYLVKYENLLFINVYVPRKHDGTNGCSKLLVKSLPFQYKLWIIVKLKIYNFIGWNELGNIIYIHYEGLENYLQSDTNLFNISAIEVFLNVLEDYGFIRLPNFIDGGRMIFAFKHELFQRHSKIFLAHIKNKNIFKLEQKWGDINNEEKKQYLLFKRMRGDLCFMRHGSMSFLQKSRMHLAVVLEFENAERLVESLIQPQIQFNTRKRRTSTFDKFSIDEPTFQFPPGMYENPYESTVKIEHFGRSYDYAGYFGKASAVQVNKFYGKLTPKYNFDPKNGIRIKKICYQKGGTGPEPEEQILPDLIPDISDVHNINVPNDLDLNITINIPNEPEDTVKPVTMKHDLNLPLLDSPEPAKPIVTEPKSNITNLDKIPKLVRDVPNVPETTKKYLSMPGCGNFNANKAKKSKVTARRVLRPVKVSPKNIKKIEAKPKKPLISKTCKQVPVAPPINELAIGHNLSDSSVSSFENTPIIKRREDSPDIDLRLSESSDEPVINTFMSLEQIREEAKNCPKEKKKATKKESKKQSLKEAEPKPVKQRKKYVRKPKDPNAPPKLTKTGKKRGPYKKKTKPVVEPTAEIPKAYFLGSCNPFVEYEQLHM